MPEGKIQSGKQTDGEKKKENEKCKISLDSMNELKVNHTFNVYAFSLLLLGAQPLVVMNHTESSAERERVGEKKKSTT